MKPRRFENQQQVQQHNSFKQFQRWRSERSNKIKSKDYSYTVPNVAPDLHYLHHNRKHPSVTWVGHSTFLIQMAGLNIVTDPVWSGNMAFEKRLAPPGIPISDMPPVDVVLISHSHYDHLNINSLRKLGGGKQILVPAGLASKLKLKGFRRIKELHWWESVHIHGVKFTFVPSQHWTRRNPWDMNSSHWGGWVMEPYAAMPSRSGDHSHEQAQLHGLGGSASVAERKQQTVGAPNAASTAAKAAEEVDRLGHTDGAGHAARPIAGIAPTVYFAGDSGYFPGFKDIGRKFQIDVALMPIGAYEPEWFMGPQHVTPEQSLQAFEDVEARFFVPMHYGAFKLADDTPREALDRLEACRDSRCIEKERIVVLPHGECWRLAGL
ncbi:MBL fold metallo-hydrolase [Paenibacillus sp. KS-LC4]|uniref:MBL fold metallo-hydrolase n=1 Tax=Paenibacillus sp. KS-LC4 TaxID=2979727 RepID=UPI0030D0CB5F